jgi:hypothetical protein
VALLIFDLIVIGAAVFEICEVKRQNVSMICFLQIFMMIFFLVFVIMEAAA